MKKLALLFLVIPTTMLFGQIEKFELPIDDETGKIKFSEVIDEDGEKDKLFNRCVYWLNSFYASPTRVTTIRDVPTGKIVGQHQFRVYFYDDDSIKQIGGMVRYTFAIEFKENRYRYVIDKLLLKSRTNVPVEKWLDKNDPAYDPRWDSYLQQIAQYVTNWSSTLKEMMHPEPEKKEDTW